MRFPLSAVLAPVVVATVVATTASTAVAAPPANDTPAGATVVLALPGTITQDTRDATTDATDAAVNAFCGAPATNASVWFVVTAPTESFSVTMQGSSYPGGFIVTDGPPATDGTNDVVSCGPTTVSVPATRGGTYYVAAFSTEAEGGTLVVTFTAGPPAPTVGLAVDRRARLTRDGSLLLTLTYTCTDATRLELTGTVTQRRGRAPASTASVAAHVPAPVCDGTPQTRRTRFGVGTALLRGGRAVVDLVAVAHSPTNLATVRLPAVTVHLRPGAD